MKKYSFLILSLLFAMHLSWAQTDMFPNYTASDFGVAFNKNHLMVYSEDTEMFTMCDSLLYYELHGMGPTSEHRWIQTTGGTQNAATTNTPPALMCRMMEVFQSNPVDLEALIGLYLSTQFNDVWVTYQDPSSVSRWHELVGDVIKGDWLVSYQVGDMVHAMVALYNSDSLKFIQPVMMKQEEGNWRFSFVAGESSKATGNFWLFYSNGHQSSEFIASNDYDGDGIINYNDNCGCTPNSDQQDDDVDGYGNACDNCPNVPNEDQFDNDHDGLGNPCDNCPDDANPDQIDTDGDKIGDACDICPNDFDPEQYYSYDDQGNKYGLACDPDIDHDGIPNEEDDDMDGDGWPNEMDNCPKRYNPSQTDSDGDGVGDVCDNCQLNSNPGQEDTDRDGVGDVCDDDIDGDGVPNVYDICPNIYNPGQEDEDCNGIGDACQDLDEDGILDIDDNCPRVYNPGQEDNDNNGVGDACEEEEE